MATDDRYTTINKPPEPAKRTNPYPEDDADDLCIDLKLTAGDKEIIMREGCHPKELPDYFKEPNFETTRWKAMKDL